MRGYQFSLSDSQEANEIDDLYNILHEHFAWFQAILAAVGFSLIRDSDVIFLADDQKDLSVEEQQTVVALFLLVDLWTERGKSYSQLFDTPIAWADLDWFRDGYGREYLLQVQITELQQIEVLWSRIKRKGLIDYQSDHRLIRLRRPAERIIVLARRIHQQLGISERT